MSTDIDRFHTGWNQYWTDLPHIRRQAPWDLSPDAVAHAHMHLFSGQFTPGLPTVDIGCGDGTQTAALTKHVDRVLGVDVSEAALARARAQHAELPISFRQLDLLRPEQAAALHDDVGDLNIYCRTVLHGFRPDELATAITSIATLAGESGTLFFFELAPHVRGFFLDIAGRRGMPDQLAFAFDRGVPMPEERADGTLQQLLGDVGIGVVCDGPSDYVSNIQLEDGRPLRIPAFFVLARPNRSVYRPGFDAFSGYAQSCALAALDMAGKLTPLADGGLVPTATEQPLLKVLTYLSSYRLVTRRPDGTYHFTPQGHRVIRDKGYLVWLVGGYGRMLHDLPAMLTGAPDTEPDHGRNGQWVAIGSGDMATADLVPSALKLLRSLDFQRVADIGCGDARFLVQVCKIFGAAGLGIDIDAGACAAAEQSVRNAGMAEQIHIVHTDAANLAGVDGIRDVDIVVTFFLLHELLARGSAVLDDFLQNLSAQLPAGAYLLAAEGQPPRPGMAANEPFTPEVTLIHELRGQQLLTADQWSELLAASGFIITQVIESGIPGGIMLLCRNNRTADTGVGSIKSGGAQSSSD